MVRLRLTLLLLLLAIAGTASAAQAQLQATSLRVQGETFLDGRLAAFESDPRDDRGGDPVGRWTLEAQHLRVERDWEANPDLKNLLLVNTREEMRPSEHVDARAVSGEARAFSYIFLAPLPGHAAPSVHGLWSDLQLGVSDVEREQHELYVRSARGELAADTRASAVATSGQAFTLTIEGDFLLSLWDWDFAVQDAAGGSDEWTGERTGMGNDPLEGQQRQQTYLYVEGGVLELHVDAPRNARLHVTPATLASSADITLVGAVGSVTTTQGTVDVLGQQVRLAGPVAVSFGTPGERLPVRVLDSQGAAWGGQSYLLREDEASGRALWLWSSGAAAVLACAVLGARRVRETWHYRRMDAAMARHDYDRALGHARRLLGSRRHGPEAIVAHAVGLLRLRRPDEALGFLEAHPRGESSLREYLRAFAYALKEEWTLAAATLDACIRLNPALEREVAANPVFRPLWGRFGASADVA